MEHHLQELLAVLVRCNSINPTLANGPGEEALAILIVERLARLGLHPELQQMAPRRANVVVRVPGRFRAPSLVLNAHLDTVGVEDMDAPFTLRRDGDRLYGRGAYDMKGSAAIMLALAEHYAASPPPGDLFLTFVADEEDRSLGTEHLIDHWLPHLDPLPAGAIVMEPTEEVIGIAHKGFVWHELQIQGRAAHGSRPERGIDAAMPLGAALHELAVLAQELRAAPADDLLGHGTLHVSLISGGSSWSVVPAHACLRWERRTIPGETEETSRRELERILEAVDSAPGGHTVTGETVFTRLPHRVAPESRPVRWLRRAVPEAPLGGVSYWADAALLGAHIPTALYGPVGQGAHGVDEWISLRSLVRVYETMVRMIDAMEE